MTFTIKLYCSESWKYLKYLSCHGDYAIRSFTTEDLARTWAEKNCKGSEGINWAIYEEDEHSVFPTSRSNKLIWETESLLASTWQKMKDILS